MNANVLVCLLFVNNKMPGQQTELMWNLLHKIARQKNQKKIHKAEFFMFMIVLYVQNT